MSNKSKTIIGTSLLAVVLVIIKVFFGGFTFTHFLEELVPEIIILLVTSLIMMLVPLIFTIAHKNKLEYKKGWRICLINSIVILILSLIPLLIMISGGVKNNTMSSFSPVHLAKGLIPVFCIESIIYYFINMCFFVDNKKK